MSTALQAMTSKLATKLDIEADSGELMNTLKATAFKGQVTDAQMVALLVVANQYGLNPWTKEVYAFPDKGGIVPVVGIDGWSRIINSHPQFDGMDFEQDAESCTCIIYRKDRNHPTKVTEWMQECSRNTGPWQSHPRRMLRHKAMIQCARLAFGYGGIFDVDEAERIVDSGGIRDVTPRQDEPAVIPHYPAEEFETNFPKWRDVIASGRRSADDIIAMIESKGQLTEQQKSQIHSCEAIEGEIA